VGTNSTLINEKSMTQLNGPNYTELEKLQI
jgi:hypothetical protein